MIWLLVGLSVLACFVGWYFILAKKSDEMREPAGGTSDEEIAEHEPNSIFVQRLPILNNQQKVIAYQLMPELVGLTAEHAEHNHFRELIAMISQYDFSELANGKKIYINVSGAELESEDMTLFPAENTVLIVSAKANQSEFVEPCKRLKKQGYQFALLTKDCIDKKHVLLDIVDFVIIDDRDKNEGINDWIQAIRGKKLRIIVCNIENQVQYENIKQFGVNAFQGFYFSDPETLENKQIGTQVKQIMNLFNLVSSKAEPEEIEEAFKVDPSLSFNLLRYINSAGFGFRNEVSSIRSALVFMGYEKLGRWLGVLLALSNDVEHEAQDALFDLATRRARLMELLGENSFSEVERDELFMTGIFSLLVTLLGMPMEKIVTNLNLPEEVLEALLPQQGRYYEVLALAIACERDTLEEIAPLADKLGLNPAEVNAKQQQANQWAAGLKAI